MKHPVRRQALAALGLGTLLAATPLSAQTPYPNKPIRLVIPFPAGGATDIIGRSLALKLSTALGQQVVVDNKPGAGGVIGAEIVAKAAPDGYTLVLATSSTHSIGPAMNARMPYDAVRDFIPVVNVANGANIDVRFRSVKFLFRHGMDSPVETFGTVD